MREDEVQNNKKEITVSVWKVESDVTQVHVMTSSKITGHSVLLSSSAAATVAITTSPDVCALIESICISMFEDERARDILR